MARVIYDGTKIVVDAARLDVDKLNKLAEKFNAEYLPTLNAFAFNRTINSVLEIAKIENAIFDESFLNLKSKIDKAVQKKQDEIAALNLPECMYPFQKESVWQMLRMTGNILLASDQGTGKTCMTIEYLACAAKHIECYPVVVVCPASLKTNWAVEFKKWNPSVTTYVVNGRTSYEDLYILNSAKQADVVIINYDILGVDDKEAQKREKERIKIAKEKGYRYRKAFIPISGWVDYINKEIKPAVLVCDECQAIESSKTVRTRGVTQIAVNENIQKVFLSGTPFTSKVAQFYNACHLLAPDLFPKEWDFKQRYCAPHYNGFGWEYKGASNIPELREKLSDIMIRHKKEDVLSQLPEKQKIPIYFDMDTNSRKVYDTMEIELAELEEGIHQFAYLAKMKEALVDIKLDAIIQFIKDMLEVEDKLVVFTYHKKTFDEIMKTFGKQCVGIDGSTPTEKRQDIVDSFQKDDSVKIFCGQEDAAGTGITLTASHTIIFTEWGKDIATMRQCEDRIHRIGQKAEHCLIYYLIVKDTIDESPLYSLDKHGKDLDAVMDGCTNVDLVDFDKVMIAKVKQRKLLKDKTKLTLEY